MLRALHARRDGALRPVGALASRPESSLDVRIAGIVLCAGAICGDSTNYWLGRWLGPRVFRSETSRLLNRRHLERAHRFYEKHGGVTVIVCRFLVVIRTFAPFVAGIGAMRYRRFLAYSVFGTLLWVWSRTVRRVGPAAQEQSRKTSSG